MFICGICKFVFDSQRTGGKANKYQSLLRFGVEIAEEELAVRAEILRKNLLKIKQHNAGPSSYKMGVNQVIDGSTKHRCHMLKHRSRHHGLTSTLQHLYLSLRTLHLRSSRTKFVAPRPAVLTRSCTPLPICLDTSPLLTCRKTLTGARRVL